MVLAINNTVAVVWAVRRVDGHHWAEASPWADTSTFSEGKVEESWSVFCAVFCAEWSCVLSVVPEFPPLSSSQTLVLVSSLAVLENLEECSSS